MNLSPNVTTVGLALMEEYANVQYVGAEIGYLKFTGELDEDLMQLICELDVCDSGRKSYEVFQYNKRTNHTNYVMNVEL